MNKWVKDALREWGRVHSSFVAVIMGQFCNIKMGQTNLEILQKSIATAGICKSETYISKKKL